MLPVTVMISFSVIVVVQYIEMACVTSSRKRYFLLRAVELIWILTRGNTFIMYLRQTHMTHRHIILCVSPVHRIFLLYPSAYNNIVHKYPRYTCRRCSTFRTSSNAHTSNFTLNRCNNIIITY